MAAQQMIASSSSSSASLKKYDVFLSFRGEDTRKNFTCHLYDALIRKKVETFIDNNELQKGDDISPTLTKAIEESYISIVIFSEDYASSKWCLNELIKILECKKDWGQIVIPVFYNIDPSHVRKQTGSYQRAFAKHKRALNLSKWKTALSEAANLAGFDSTKSSNESYLIKDIVEDVLRKLKHRYPFEVQDKGLVRIEKRCEEIESLLKVGSNDVRIIGLWGMGGIGKTTLAKALCAKLCPQFEGWCFLENVRDELKKDGLIVVRHRLFSSLSEEENLRLDAPYIETHSIKRKLFGKKLLIVLDDVATSKQLESLMIDTNILGSGSRVIVTTRDKHIISHAHQIYEVKELEECDSLELFSLNSFNEKNPKIGYEELSKSAIAYCKGNPLALKVLGTRLGPRSKLAWESDLQKLQKIPDMEIHDVLKLSYDDLDRTQKDIFLDIACFFKGWDRDCVISVLEACGFFAKVGVEDLLDKALITISEYNKIEMHDLIQEMGREIINQESIKEPGERSRLWRGKEVADVLKKNKGTEAVEGIKLDSSKVGDLFLRPDSFKRMTNLRYLEIYNNVDSNVGKIYFNDGLELLSDKLRYLRWDYFPSECLPSNFSAEMLVELRMKDSKLKKLWDGVQNLVNLKEIELDFSKDLIEMPDLSRATNLQTLSLYECESLRELSPFILSLPKLEELVLSGCKRIESLKSNVHSKSLRGLYLKNCSSLPEFSVISEEITQLDLGDTAIREIPSSIWRYRKLQSLALSDFIGNKLSNDTGIMESLKELYLSGCTHIDASGLSLLLDGIPCLEVLHLIGCRSLEALPHNIHKHIELKQLVLDDCRQLVASLAELIPSSQLQKLSVVNCTLMDTESTQQLMLEKQFSDHATWWSPPILFMPGDQVPGKFNFEKAEGASITIPHIPKLNLGGFIFCIILSQGLQFAFGQILTLCCTVYEHGEAIRKTCFPIKHNVGTLISDHVLLCWHHYLSGENGGDHYSLSFEFELSYRTVDGCREWSTEGIKRCGVLLVYDLELIDKSISNLTFLTGLYAKTSTADHVWLSQDGLSFELELFYETGDGYREYSTERIKGCGVFLEYDLLLDDKSIRSRLEIVELESSNAQVSDVGDSSDENEDDQQHLSYYLEQEEEEEEEEDFNEKSSCGCSIGLVWKYLLERSTQHIHY